MNRHVVIGPDPNAPRQSRGGRGSKGRYDRRPRRNFGNNTSVSDNAPKRAPINEGEGAALYGRIDK